MQAFTNLADQSVMLPVAAAVGAAMALGRWWRGVAVWLLVICGFIGSMAALKFLAYACASVVGAWDLHNPSGHTAASVAIVGGALVVAFRGLVRPALLACVPVAIAVAVGASRVVLGVHSVPDVVAGGLVGLVVVALLLVLLADRPQTMRPLPIVAAMLMVGAVFYGGRIHEEELIRNFPLFGWVPLPHMCAAPA